MVVTGKQIQLENLILLQQKCIVQNITEGRNTCLRLRHPGIGGKEGMLETIYCKTPLLK